MNKDRVWIITPKTNLHVGNENSASYGLIDLAVQRDAVTELPCINSSSLKGAINEYAAKRTQLNLLDIFGSDKRTKSASTQKGKCTFFDAKIIAIPDIDNDDKELFVLKSCEKVIQTCIDLAASLGIVIQKSDLVDDKVKMVDYAEFKELCDNDNLPIIARNKLEDGTSANLWYEQVLPAETKLFTIIDGPDKIYSDFRSAISGKTIQVGANGSIGYGYCVFETVNK